MPQASPKALPPIFETLAELILIDKEQAPASTIDVYTSEDLPIPVPYSSRALAAIQHGPFWALAGVLLNLMLQQQWWSTLARFLGRTLSSPSRGPSSEKLSLAAYLRCGIYRTPWVLCWHKHTYHN